MKPVQSFFSMIGDVPFSAVDWMDLSGRGFDSVNMRHRFEGTCVKGVGTMVNGFIASRNLTCGRLNTWMGPYSNVYFVNLRWLRQQALILEFMEAVDSTGCIFSNRWGDHVLWGAALAVASVPKFILNMTYYHGSHRVTVRPHAPFLI